MSKYLGLAFPAEVRAVLLTGLSTATSTAIAAIDSILVALGKLQAQINLRAPLAGPTFSGNATFSSTTGIVAAGDQTIPNWAAFGGIVQVGGKDGYNAIVGVVSNNAPAGTAVFPTGVTGAARLSSAGSTAFGLFGRADQYSAGCATNEVNSFNYNVAPSSALPPDRSFGTTATTPVALTVAAGGTFSSSVGVQICREGSAPQPFLTGLYINPDGATTYGMLVDSDGTSGPTFPLYVKPKSGNVGITVAPQGTASPTAASVQLKDASGASVLVLQQNGTITSNGQLLVTDSGSALTYHLSVDASINTGGASIRLNGNGTGGQKYIRARAGLLEFVNSSLTTVLASLDETGNFFAGPTGSVQVLDASTTPKSHVILSAASNTGGVQLQLQGNGATTPKKYIRVQGGLFSILSDAGTAIATLTDAGALTTTGPHTISDAGTTALTHLSVQAASNTNGAQVQFIGNGATTPKKYLRVKSGALDVLNDAGTSIINVTDAGAMQTSGAITVLDAGTSPLNHVVVNAASNTNGAQIQLIGNGATTPKKHIRVQGGNLLIMNDAGSAIATLNDAGGLSITDLNVNSTSSVAGAWTSTTGTVGAISGTLGSGNTGTINYKKIGRTVDLNIVISIGASGQGTGAGGITLVLPWTAAQVCVISGRELNATGKALTGTVWAGTSLMNVQNYDNSYPAANGYLLVLNGIIEVTT